jgi:4'-phosphopantetheinyl transferase
MARIVAGAAPPLQSGEIHIRTVQVDEEVPLPVDVHLRGFCNQILADYCGCLSETLRFSYGPWGKPRIAVGGSRRLFHSISHSGRRAAVAVCLDGEVGIDIEAVRPERRISDIVAYAFLPEEIAAVEASDAQERVTVFYDLWTKKEALIKAAGASVAVYMDRAAILGRAAENGWAPARIHGRPENWYVQALPVFPGYAAAVCGTTATAQVVVVGATKKED